MARANKQLYVELLSITTDYLGPAAPRFIDRQIQNHLNKEPSTITVSDLKELIDWIQTSIAHLTEDKRIRREYTDRLKGLVATKGAKRGTSHGGD